MGTTGYMSPEQAQGKPADHRSDVFAFGVVLYEMLSADTPFKRPSAVETVHAIINAPDPPVNLPHEGEAASELRRIVHKCLAKDPRDRYQTMRDLVVDLREVGRRLEPVEPPVAISPVSPARTWPGAGGRRARDAGRRRRWSALRSTARAARQCQPEERVRGSRSCCSRISALPRTSTSPPGSPRKSPAAWPVSVSCR